MPRFKASAECNTGVVCLALPDRTLRLSPVEAEFALKSLAWAVRASREETFNHYQNRNRLEATYGQACAA